MIMDMSEQRAVSVPENDGDTLEPKDEYPAPVIGERFVPQYMQFNDWGAHRRDTFPELGKPSG
jgi:hypothetical protein